MNLAGGAPSAAELPERVLLSTGAKQAAGRRRKATRSVAVVRPLSDEVDEALPSREGDDNGRRDGSTAQCDRGRYGP